MWGPRRLSGGVLALWTSREAGDQRLLGGARRPPAVVPRDLRVRRLNQQHGAAVVVDAPARNEVGVGDLVGAAGSVPEADAVVSHDRGSCLAVLTADCAAVGLASPEGIFGAVHVGWRGLAAGVVENAVGAMKHLGAEQLAAGIGPCIHACCYRFVSPELERLTERYGPQVRAVTTRGEPALDLPEAVRSALTLAGARIVVDVDHCTGCSDNAYSYRARGDEERQAMLVWVDPSA